MLEVILQIYENFLLSFPETVRIIPKLLVFAILIAIYSMVVWVFYRFLAKRDIIELNLKKYNVFEHAGVVKFFAVIFYTLEFIIFIPIVIIVWFSILSGLLIVLAKEQPVETVLLISASVVAAVRITTYYKEDLAKELAKMFPFTLLSIAILTPGFFNFSLTVERMSQVPSLLGNILYYAVFIIIVETIMRLFTLTGHIIKSYSGDKGEIK